MDEGNLMNVPDDLFEAWTRLPRLKFSDEYIDSVSATRNMHKLGVYFDSFSAKRNMHLDIISKIIRMQCTHLETFELCNCDWFGSYTIRKWLLWTSLLGVKSIVLKSSYDLYDIPKEVLECIFSCMTATSLSLTNFKMTTVPALLHGFSQLATLHLENVEFSEQVLEVILESCDRLQHLTVSNCNLPITLIINSFTLKSLDIVGCRTSSICAIEATCPTLESIKFVANGRFEIRMGNFYLPACVRLQTEFVYLENFVTVTSLRNITCVYGQTFGKILQSFPHLEELCLESPLLYPDDLGDPTLQLANLQTFIVNIPLSNVEGYADAYPEKYDIVVSLCACVLKRAPQLKEVIIRADFSLETFRPDEFYEFLQFFNDFLRLVRDFPAIDFSVSRRIAQPDELLWYHPV